MTRDEDLDPEELALWWEFLEAWHLGDHGSSIPPHVSEEERRRFDHETADLDRLAAEHCRAHGITRPRRAEEIYGGPLPCMEDAQPGYYATPSGSPPLE